jgi:hypothetical protein
LIILSSFFFCHKKKKNDPEPEPESVYDKKGMLENIADNLILPNYRSFQSSLDSLITVYNIFKTSGSLADFQSVKQKFNTVYFKYQRIDLYEFGPAENSVIRMSFNIFPTDTVQIKSNITSGNYDLSAASNFDAKGLPALDYLFYSASESVALLSFTASASRKQYVSDLLGDMSGKINSVIGSWNSYRETFVNSLGTDVGSSIGFLVNQLNYELDYLKNAKIGIPLGKKTLGTPQPDKCESYFAAHSAQYAMETLKLVENVYLGRNLAGDNGLGFDDYLIHLKTEYNGGSLNDAINNQFAAAKNKLAAVPDPLSTQVVSNATAVDAAYMELVKLLVLLKTDMPSGLGVIITYQDGDGD